MHSCSVPRAAPSADRISDRLEEGSADTSRSARPCSRVSWRRAVESTGCPDSRATTSSGWVLSGSRSATIRPCRSTRIRSASRNIWSMSWHASRIVVPFSRSPAMSSSTWAASMTPSDAVGSSRASSRGWLPMARATATSWRWPPDRELTRRAVFRIGIPRLSSSDAAAAWKRLSEKIIRRVSRPSRTFAATSRFSHSARSCQTTATPWRATAAGFGSTRRPERKISPCVGVMSPAMQRTSVVLPARSPRPGRQAHQGGP